MTITSAERLAYRPSDFKAIQSILYSQAGINLHDGKKELVYSRLAKRVRRLGMSTFRDYCSKLDNDEQEVLEYQQSVLELGRLRNDG